MSEFFSLLLNGLMLNVYFTSMLKMISIRILKKEITESFNMRTSLKGRVHEQVQALTFSSDMARVYNWDVKRRSKDNLVKSAERP